MRSPFPLSPCPCCGKSPYHAGPYGLLDLVLTIHGEARPNESTEALMCPSCLWTPPRVSTGGGRAFTAWNQAADGASGDLTDRCEAMGHINEILDHAKGWRILRFALRVIARTIQGREYGRAFLKEMPQPSLPKVWLAGPRERRAFTIRRTIINADFEAVQGKTSVIGVSYISGFFRTAREAFMTAKAMNRDGSAPRYSKHQGMWVRQEYTAVEAVPYKKKASRRAGKN